MFEKTPQQSPESKKESRSIRSELSPEFKSLIDTEQKQKELIEGSHVYIQNDEKSVSHPVLYYEQWERARHFIADAIHKDGVFLDIGCANGFMLRCLQEWSGKQLDPYGIDTDPEMIKRAQALFPGQQDHFAATRTESMPKQFDIIYWNIWDNWDFAEENQRQALQKTYDAVAPGGRLILGFYDPKPTANKRIETLKKLGFKIDGQLEHPAEDIIITWIKKPE